MRNTGLFPGRGFCGADVEFTIDCDRIAVDDLSLKARGKFERKCSFSTAGGTEDYNQQGVGCNQRALQLMWCQERVIVIARIKIKMIMRPIVSSRCVRLESGFGRRLRPALDTNSL